MKKSSNTYLLFLLLIIIFGFLAVSDNFLSSQNPETSPLGIPITVTAPVNSKKSLQLNILPFISATPTVASSAGQSSSAACSPPSANLSDVVTAVKQQYGLILHGNALTLPRATVIYESMCLAFQSPTYKQSLNSLQHPVDVTFNNAGTCFAWTYGNPAQTTLEEPCDTTLIDKYIIIHELTHVMQMGGGLGRDGHWAAWQAVWAKEKNHKIPTGPCVIEDPGDGGECEADAVAEYMYYKVYRNSWGGQPPGSYTFANYKTDYPLWYNFVKDNFFGGLEF